MELNHRANFSDSYLVGVVDLVTEPFKGLSAVYVPTSGPRLIARGTWGCGEPVVLIRRARDVIEQLLVKRIADSIKNVVRAGHEIKVVFAQQEVNMGEEHGSATRRVASVKRPAMTRRVVMLRGAMRDHRRGHRRLNLVACLREAVNSLAFGNGTNVTFGKLLGVPAIRADESDRFAI